MTATLTHYLCIGCPLGCRLEVAEEDGAIVEVRGFGCKKGKEYAEQEHVDPRRMVTGTVSINNGSWARLPVKTSRPVRKDQVKAIAAALRRAQVAAPVRLGEVILPDVLGSGADIVATRDIAAGNSS